MGFVLRRSLPALSGLVALLVAAGWAFVTFVGGPAWLPVAVPVVFVLIQYLLGPWLIQWLVPAEVVGPGHVVYEAVAWHCARAGVPVAKVGLVDDGNPNAFAFGRTRRDARIWVTRGLVERLDERELRAVLAHEVGHVKHRDFIVMTVAAIIPMVLYLTYLLARGSGRDEARPVALAAYLGYLVSELTVLGLSRAREYAADHWSCAATADGDALCSALVKIAYGMGQVRAEEESEGKVGRRALAARSIRVMGIFEPRMADAMAPVVADGMDEQRVVAALRWDVVNPWAKVLEKVSTHPLVARRIAALESSGLPGRPVRWSVLRAAAAASPETVTRARTRFGYEVFVMLAPWAMLAAVLGFGAYAESRLTTGAAVAAAGLLFFWKQSVRYPTDHEAVDSIADLATRVDASPMAGLPVSVKGRVVGRGDPGFVLSPHLVVADETGFVTVLYRQPLPFADLLFGLRRVNRFKGQNVVVRGWYRRAPGPLLEMRDVLAADGEHSRSWWWRIQYACAGLVTLVGAFLVVTGLGAGVAA